MNEDVLSRINQLSAVELDAFIEYHDALGVYSRSLQNKRRLPSGNVYQFQADKLPTDTGKWRNDHFVENDRWKTRWFEFDGNANKLIIKEKEGGDLTATQNFNPRLIKMDVERDEVGLI